MRRTLCFNILAQSVVLLAATTGILAAEAAPSTAEARSAEVAEKQVIRTFHLENMALKDAMTMVRSLVGTKHVAASETLNGLVVRDHAGKVEVIERLLSTVDKPRAEVALDVDFLYLKGGRSEQLSGGSRLSAEEVMKLRRGARSLMRQEISILENDTANWALKDRVVAHESYLDVGFELKVQSRVHGASDEVTLRYDFKMSDGNPGAGAVVTNGDFESATRLRSGETILLSGLAVGAAAGGEPSWLASRFDLPTGPGEVILALTPRIVRGPGFTESDLAAICVGTDRHVGLCDLAETSGMAFQISGGAGFGDAGGLDEKSREEVRERLRGRLRSLKEAEESASDSSFSSEEE